MLNKEYSNNYTPQHPTSKISDFFENKKVLETLSDNDAIKQKIVINKFGKFSNDDIIDEFADLKCNLRS